MRILIDICYNVSNIYNYFIKKTKLKIIKMIQYLPYIKFEIILVFLGIWILSCY
jgi:hypothetical protein